MRHHFLKSPALDLASVALQSYITFIVATSTAVCEANSLPTALHSHRKQKSLLDTHLGTFRHLHDVPVAVL